MSVPLAEGVREPSQSADRIRGKRESRRAASLRHSCWRKRLRSIDGGLVDLVVNLARTEFSVANRQNRAPSAASIHRSNVLCFIARILPQKGHLTRQRMGLIAPAMC